MIKLELHEQELEFIMQLVYQRPYGEVHKLVEKIKQQSLPLLVPRSGTAAPSASQSAGHEPGSAQSES